MRFPEDIAIREVSRHGLVNVRVRSNVLISLTGPGSDFELRISGGCCVHLFLHRSRWDSISFVSPCKTNSVSLNTFNLLATFVTTSYL